jgi:hypothetical protein
MGLHPFSAGKKRGFYLVLSKEIDDSVIIEPALSFSRSQRSKVRASSFSFPLSFTDRIEPRSAAGKGARRWLVICRSGGIG